MATKPAVNITTVDSRTSLSPNTTVKVKPTFWNISTRADQTTDTDRPNSYSVERLRECGYYSVYFSILVIILEIVVVLDG